MDVKPGQYQKYAGKTPNNRDVIPAKSVGGWDKGYKDILNLSSLNNDNLCSIAQKHFCPREHFLTNTIVLASHTFIAFIVFEQVS